MKITYFGHSCFAVETGNGRLLFDPFISGNPLASHIDPETISADFILLSHGHADHVADAPAIARRTGATVIANFEVAQWLSAQGLAKVHAMNHGGWAKFGFGRAQYVNAVHSSSLPDGSYGGNPGGFVIESTRGRFYYSGDTALTFDMQLVARGGELLFAALPIGDNFTMGVADAIQAARWCGAREVLGVHYDTFPPIQIDRDSAGLEFRNAGLSLHLPPIGDTIDIG